MTPQQTLLSTVDCRLRPSRNCIAFIFSLLPASILLLLSRQLKLLVKRRCWLKRNVSEMSYSVSLSGTLNWTRSVNPATIFRAVCLIYSLVRHTLRYSRQILRRPSVRPSSGSRFFFGVNFITIDASVCVTILLPVAVHARVLCLLLTCLCPSHISVFSILHST